MTDRYAIARVANTHGWNMVSVFDDEITLSPTEDLRHRNRITVTFDPHGGAVRADTYHGSQTGPPDGRIRDIVIAHLERHAPTTKENTVSTTINASRDGIIDLALANGWTLGQDRHDGGLSLSKKPRNGSPVQFTLHFADPYEDDGHPLLERVEYSDGEQGTPDWMPGDAQERAYQLCRAIVGPAGHVTDPALVKLEAKVDQHMRTTGRSFETIEDRMSDHRTGTLGRIHAVERWQDKMMPVLAIAGILIVVALIFAIVAVVIA